MIILRCP